MARTANRILAEEGAELFLIDVNRQALEAYRNEYPWARICPADASDYGQMEAAMRRAQEELGRIDILLNVCGIIRHLPIDEMAEEDWQKVIDVNLTGYFHSCKCVVPYMKAERYGRIVNISSLGGRTGRPGVGVNYAASKAGVIGMTQLLARELAPWNITVNAIAPGPLQGEMFSSMTKENQNRLAEGIPLGFLGNMEQIAYGIVYLASDESSYTTGEVLDINGGIYI